MRVSPGQVGDGFHVLPFGAGLQLYCLAQGIPAVADVGQVDDLHTWVLRRSCYVVRLRESLALSRGSLGAGENVHPFQAVVHVVAILDAVDEHRLGQLAVHVGADGVDAVCADEADADIISGLVRLPSTAAQRQGDRKDAASAWADDFLHLAVEPIRPGAALDIDLQLQCGQAGKLGADGSRQAQCPWCRGHGCRHRR